MTVHPFDYATFWRTTGDQWRQRRLHWHCHSSRMDAATYGNEAARRDLGTELPPREIRDWLQKPATAVRHVARTPDEAVSWFADQWAPVKAQAGQEAEAIPDEVRLGIALHDLSVGNDVCWGFWLGTSAYLHLAVVGTDAGCH